MQDTDAFFTPDPTTTTRSRRRRDTLRAAAKTASLTFPSGFTTPHPRKQHRRARATSPPIRSASREAGIADAPRGRRARAVELRRRGPHRAVQAAVEARHRLAAHQPALSRSRACRPNSRAPTTSSARTSSARCRCAGRRCATSGSRCGGCATRATSGSDCSARASARAWRMLTDVPRAAGPRAGAQSRLAVFRRRRVARAVDRARAPGTRRPRRPRGQLRDLWRPISPWSLPRSRCSDKQHADGLREVRPHVPGRSVAEADRRRSKRRAITAAKSRVLPCGHYSTGAAPFKYHRRLVSRQFSREKTLRSLAGLAGAVVPELYRRTSRYFSS